MLLLLLVSSSDDDAGRDRGALLPMTSRRHIVQYEFKAIQSGKLLIPTIVSTLNTHTLHSHTAVQPCLPYFSRLLEWFLWLWIRTFPFNFFKNQSLGGGAPNCHTCVQLAAQDGCHNAALAPPVIFAIHRPQIFFSLSQTDENASCLLSLCRCRPRRRLESGTQIHHWKKRANQNKRWQAFFGG